MAGGAGAGVHIIRFYLPALGLIALLAAWLLVQLPRSLIVTLLVALIGIGAGVTRTSQQEASVGPARAAPEAAVRPEWAPRRRP